MSFYPFALWQHFLDGGGSSRFSLGGSEEIEETVVRNGGVPLESLRADVIIALFNLLTTTSIEHPHLAPALMDGLDCALEQLSEVQERELREIQQWLCQENGESQSEIEIS